MSIKDTAGAALGSQREQLIARLFTPAPLVQPGWQVECNAELRDRFERAATCFRKGKMADALACFQDVEVAAERIAEGAGRTARFNAAATAMAAGQENLVVQLLEPLFKEGRIYGLPLWNIALAFYRSGNRERALKALTTWVAKAPRSHLVRGRLVAAIIASELGKTGEAASLLKGALDEDPGLVSRLLRLAPGPLAPRSEDSEQEIQRQLQLLVRPRRPERTPTLLSVLPDSDVRRFDKALEQLAEADYAAALPELRELSESHPGISALEAALASGLLFAGHTEEAKRLLGRVMETATPSGNTLWNLACAQIRSGDLAGATQALQACARTEYRTSVALHRALDVLSGTRDLASTDSTSQVAAGFNLRALTRDLPADLSTRREILIGRLLRPKRLAKSYRPDLIALRQQDRSRVDQALDTARSLEATHAVRLLRPLLVQYPRNYTIRIHAASYALQIGGSSEIAEAELFLLEAESIREFLDADSRMNLAYAQFVGKKPRSVLDTLERGLDTPPLRARARITSTVSR